MTAQDQEAICQALTDYHRLFQKCFYRREQRHCSALYLCGQLSKVERKTIEPMLLDLLGPDRNAVRAVQEFIGAGQWEALDLIRRHQELVAQSLGRPRGVVIVDGSGFPKQGAHSAGVAPVGIAPRTLADMSGQRWPIATIFEEAKGEVDMDHYETRTWVGWQHHMAHHFLMQVRAQLKKSPALTTAQARQLVAQIIDNEKCRSEVFDVIADRQRRNYAAYQSHRKHTVQRHQKRGAKPKKSKVS